MKNTFTGSDFGIFVFGREILKKNNTAHLSFEIKDNIPHSEAEYWQKAIEQIATQTKFGRIGLIYERKNTNAQQFIHTLSTQDIPYTPKSQRAEKKLCIKTFETQVLKEMANEGLADSVEFRRLARKYIRTMKHAHRDSVFFLDSILGEEKTQKILKHLAGTQIKCYFPSDFLEISKEQNEKRELKIITNDTPHFTHKRAEEILKTKISLQNIESKL